MYENTNRISPTIPLVRLTGALGECEDIECEKVQYESTQKLTATYGERLFSLINTECRTSLKRSDLVTVISVKVNFTSRSPSSEQAFLFKDVPQGLTQPSATCKITVIPDEPVPLLESLSGPMEHDNGQRPCLDREPHSPYHLAIGTLLWYYLGRTLVMEKSTEILVRGHLFIEPGPSSLRVNDRNGSRSFVSNPGTRTAAQSRLETRLILRPGHET